MTSTLLTVGEVAEMVRAPESTVRFWVHKGTGPRSFKVGRRRMFKATDVAEWLEEQYAAGEGQYATAGEGQGTR